MLKNLTNAPLRTCAVFCLSALLACSTSRPGNQNQSETARTPTTTTSSTAIKVHFHGLMVFHKLESQYEVGILSKAAALGHHFTIAVDPPQSPDASKAPDESLTNRLKSLGNDWELVVVRQGATVNQTIGFKGTALSSRMPRDETDTNKEFFDWIIDLESSQFHGKELYLNPGLLTPIIRISAGGELFTEAKSDELQRCQGEDCLHTGPFSDFGFIAEIVTLEVILQTGEELVLRVTGKGSEGEAFTLSAGAPHDVFIVNGPDKSHYKREDVSHFTYYYNLFNNVDEPYDVKLKKNGAKPKNPFFDAKEEGFRELATKSVYGFDMTTVDDTSCGAIKLGLRAGGKPLSQAP